MLSINYTQTTHFENKKKNKQNTRVILMKLKEKRASKKNLKILQISSNELFLL